ncbi:methylenetetrahydrofolate reductase [Pseudogemmobacter sonorensis]|uniref:methylenetetrahydrofolate reductase n=1 Tax=Pseudogemmobacter sonorensis TaxID=2989681 RepID=UPI0036A09036
MPMFAPRGTATAASGPLESLLGGCSIEVMPRTAAKIADFRSLLAPGSRIYIAHIDGTPFDDMLATARRLTEEGFQVMPHFPARLIRDRAMLADRVARYRDAGVRQGLLIAGGMARPRGDFSTSMQLLESGAFDGFERLHVAGHPEGSRDIDPDGSDRMVMAAARWKSAFAERSDARMAMTTQFCFDPGPVLDWIRRLRAEGVSLPVHVGVAGPAKLQTLIKFALACGVGPSIKVLQKRAMDVTKLLLPYEPNGFLTELAAMRSREPDSGIQSVHFFPLGGIAATAGWIATHAAAAGTAGTAHAKVSGQAPTP